MDRGRCERCVSAWSKILEHSCSAKPAVALAGVHSALMPAARITLPHFSV
jgi:hypothetical protein